jgi:hypothetical protein
MGGLEVGDDGFVEDFSCGIKDLGEAGVGGCEWILELEEGFGDGAGGGAGEAEDADAAAAGRGGDGDDGVGINRDVINRDGVDGVVVGVGSAHAAGFLGLQLIGYCLK